MKTNEEYFKEAEKVDSLLKLFDVLIRNGIDNTSIHIVKEDKDIDFCNLNTELGVVGEDSNLPVRKGVYVYASENLSEEDRFFLKDELTDLYLTDYKEYIYFFAV